MRKRVVVEMPHAHSMLTLAETSPEEHFLDLWSKLQKFTAVYKEVFCFTCFKPMPC